MRVLQQSGTPAQVPRHQNPLIPDICFSSPVAIAIFAREKKNRARKYELHYSLLQARSSSPLQYSTDQEFIQNSQRPPAPSSINPAYYPNRLPSDPSPSRSRLVYPQAKEEEEKVYLAGSVAGDALLRPHAGLQRPLARSAPAAEGRRLPPAPTSARAEVARRGLRCGVRRLL